MPFDDALNLQKHQIFLPQMALLVITVYKSSFMFIILIQPSMSSIIFIPCVHTHMRAHIAISCKLKNELAYIKP